MIWLLALLAVVGVVVIGLVTVGRETSLLLGTPRPAVFDLEEAVQFIAESLPDDVAGRVSLDDVRWVLRADVDALEEATAERPDDGGEEPATDEDEIVDEDDAVARILGRAIDEDRDITDHDVVAILDARLAYLEVIGAIGPRADPAP